jgi:3-oxoacyl-[acyl-carrier protein] reductase
MKLGLKDKVAMITGASRGIGKSCALTMAEEGCHLAVCARNKEALDEAAEEFKAKGVEVLTVRADVAKAEDIDNFVSRTAEKFNRIDILVNNAGTGRYMELMFFSLMRCSKQAAGYMQKQKWGRIINISSIFGKQPGGLVDYDAIKAAVIMFGKDLANYLAKDNILVNTICPGPIRTPLWEGPGALGEQLGSVLNMSGPEAIKWFAEQNIPLGHHGDPEDIANLVAFLASDKAKFITGQAINVDGGMVKGNI